MHVGPQSFVLWACFALINYLAFLPVPGYFWTLPWDSIHLLLAPPPGPSLRQVLIQREPIFMKSGLKMSLSMDSTKLPHTYSRGFPTILTTFTTLTTRNKSTQTGQTFPLCTYNISESSYLRQGRV